MSAGWAAFGQAAANVLGSAASAALSYGSAKKLQEDAQQFATSFYEQRYQRMMADMRKAGLNPILAYKTGAPGGPGAGLASAGQLGSELPTSGTKVLQARLLAEQTRAAAADAQAREAALPELRARAQWAADHPELIMQREAAQVRATTGSNVIDQAKGAAIQGGASPQTKSFYEDTLKPMANDIWNWIWPNQPTGAQPNAPSNQYQPTQPTPDRGPYWQKHK